MRFLVIALLLTGCPGPDGLSPRESCEQGAATQCERMYACLTAEQLAAAGWPSTEAGCTTKLQEERGCAAETAANVCKIGTYHAADAATCIDQIAGLECSQLLDRTIDLKVAAPACGRVCRVE